MSRSARVSVFVAANAWLAALAPVAIHAQGQSVGVQARDSAIAAALARITPEGLRAHIVELASDTYEGRGAGYAGDARATTYIARYFESLGLTAAGDTIDGRVTHWQHVELHPRRPPAPWAKLITRNVLGLLEGCDSLVKREVVVIGAHHDGQGMVGQANMGRRAPPDSTDDIIYNAANDNAAGVAAVLEIAAAIQRAAIRPKRSILFMTFAAEEHGLVGALHYAADPAFDWERHVAMINFDMIGWDPDHPLNARATGTSPAWAVVLERATAITGTSVTMRTPELTNDTDHYAFAARGVPAIHFGVAGSREHYHAVSDAPELVHYDALAERARYALATLLVLADLPERPAFVGQPGPDAGLTGTGATAAELDMLGLASEQGGVKLTAVAPGLPGARAGLRAGDLIVEMDGQPLTREQPGMRVLGERVRNAVPGDSIVLSVLRAGRRITITLQLDS